MLNCGKYNKKITFFRQNEKSDEESEFLGQQLEPFCKVFASVKATGGGESYEADRLNNTISYDIRTRFSKRLFDENLIIGYRGRRLEIRSVVNVREENTELAFTCTEIRKAGGDYGGSDFFYN